MRVLARGVALATWRQAGQSRKVTGTVTGAVSDRRAVTAIEYAIIAGIMVVALVVSVPFIGKSLSPIFNQVSSEL